MMHSTFRSVAFYIWDVRPSYSNGVRRGGSSILVWEGHWQEVWGQKSPRGVQGHSPGGDLGSKPPEARRMLHHPLTEKKQAYTDLHCMTIS